MGTEANHNATVWPSLCTVKLEQCNNTNQIGCYTLYGIFSCHIIIMLLSIILLASIKYAQKRKFTCKKTLWRVRRIFLDSTLS